MEIVRIESYCVRLIVFYDSRFSFFIVYFFIVNDLFDLKFFFYFCRFCRVGMLRFLMVILITVFFLCVVLGWFKVDVYVKNKIFEKYNLNFFIY